MRDGERATGIRVVRVEYSLVPRSVSFVSVERPGEGEEGWYHLDNRLG